MGSNGGWTEPHEPNLNLPLYTVLLKNSNNVPIPKMLTDNSVITLRNIKIPTTRNSIGTPKTRRGDYGSVPIPKMLGTYIISIDWTLSNVCCTRAGSAVKNGALKQSAV